MTNWLFRFFFFAVGVKGKDMGRRKVKRGGVNKRKSVGVGSWEFKEEKDERKRFDRV